ncbi:MAG: sigma-70 family RNA polymerase sigma factor [bacterium]
MQFMDRRVANKDPNKYRDFAAEAFPLMNKFYSIALTMTRDQFDAEDLVQNSYLKAWRFYDNFQSGTNFEGWMMRILTNNFINDYRKKKRRPGQLDFDIVSDTHAIAESPEETIQEELVEKYEEVFDDGITRALDKLPDHFRTVVLLADVNSLKYHEIADLLNCPIGTVMSRLNRGRRQLAKSLKPYAVEHGYL